MCGFAGERYAAPVPADRLACEGRAMIACVRHRGPDAEGLWIEPHGMGVLSFARLAIQDLSPAAGQPMHSESGRFTIVYNGEVYNADELRNRIGRAASTFRTHSDTEVLLACIEKLGLEETLRAVNGMFAIALWDRERDCILLARDRVGKKPLHYAADPERVVFASEIKSILQLDREPRRVSQPAVDAFFRFTYIPTSLCIFEGIRKVPPGRVVKIASDLTISEQPYWAIEEAIARSASAPKRPYRELLEQADGMLGDAVRRRLVSDVPVALLLSGGVDSGLVAHALKRLGADVQCFTVGFEDERFDESAHATAIARRIGIRHEVLRLSKSEALRLVDTALDTLDEPLADGSAVPTFAVCRLARAAATVLLTGDGGDEVFGGYTRYLWSGGWRGLAAAGYASLRRRRPVLSRSSVAIEIYRRLLSLGEEGGSAPAALLHHLVPGLDRPQPLSVLQWMRYLDFQLYLPDDILVKTDRMSMANSVELRSPFLDYRLVEESWSLPDSALIHGPMQKRMLRDLFARHIGRDLLMAEKRGFGLPIGEWLRGPLREQLETALDELGRTGRIPAWAGTRDEILRAVHSPKISDPMRAWIPFAFWRWSRAWERTRQVPSLATA